jgi:DNA-binding transcriptional ArsR family regulator
LAEGHDPGDIATARAVQDAQARMGLKPQSLKTILTGQAPTNTPKAPEDLGARQLRKRGRYGQAALLADQEALAEEDPTRAQKAREASGILKQLARKPEQVEFDFWRGNVMTADEYHDAIRERLKETGATLAERSICLSVLMEIRRWLLWQSFECGKTAVEIGELLDIKQNHMSRILSRLEEVGAISRIKRGRSKTIVLNPEGTYRGDVNHHAEVMDKYKAEVVPLRPDLHPAS